MKFDEAVPFTLSFLVFFATFLYSVYNVVQDCAQYLSLSDTISLSKATVKPFVA